MLIFEFFFCARYITNAPYDLQLKGILKLYINNLNTDNTCISYLDLKLPGKQLIVIPIEACSIQITSE